MITELELCSRLSACLSGLELSSRDFSTSYKFVVKIESKTHGNYRKTRQRCKDTEVQVPPAQSLPALRPPPCLPPEVRRVPSLLPQSRPQGRNSGRSQVQLVILILRSFGCALPPETSFGLPLRMQQSGSIISISKRHSRWFSQRYCERTGNEGEE